MRVHGEVKIIRRDDVKPQSNYKNYESELSDDFCHICGYCGKSEQATTKGFEIDHFVPDTIDSSKKTDYSNLVYSCFTCNRKKSGKWPTNDKNAPNDGQIGFVDPASEAFDLHLKREEDGHIVCLTSIGVYMGQKVFKFHRRPMKEIWLYSKLIERKIILKNQMPSLSNEKQIEFNKILDELDGLHGLFFSKRE